MTVGMMIGRIQMQTDEDDPEPYRTVDWQPTPHEPDGTSEEYTAFSGTPLRNHPNAFWYQVLDDSPELRRLYELCKPEFPGFHNPEVVPITSDIRRAVAELPEVGDPFVADIARYFKYWTARALQEFGPEAGIEFH